MTSEILLTQAQNTCTLIPSRGGFISSLKLAGKELLWMPDSFSPQDSSWPDGGIPFCFPFAGRVWHQGHLHQYGLNGETFLMPIHGFAYGESWSGIKLSPSEAVLELNDSERTRSIYPFSFKATLKMTLTDTALRIEFKIKHINPIGSAKEMPVALGFHPYFKLEDSRAATLELEADKYYPVTPAGAAGRVTPISDLTKTPWSIHAPLLNSLILSDLQATEAKLNLGRNTQVKMQFGPETLFHHIVVWTNRIEEFYCVEPWMSLPDAVATPTGCKWLKAEEECSGYLNLSLLNRSS